MQNDSSAGTRTQVNGPLSHTAEANAKAEIACKVSRLAYYTKDELIRVRRELSEAIESKDYAAVNALYVKHSGCKPYKERNDAQLKAILGKHKNSETISVLGLLSMDRIKKQPVGYLFDFDTIYKRIGDEIVKAIVDGDIDKLSRYTSGTKYLKEVGAYDCDSSLDDFEWADQLAQKIEDYAEATGDDWNTDAFMNDPTVVCMESRKTVTKRVRILGYQGKPGRPKATKTRDIRIS